VNCLLLFKERNNGEFVFQTKLDEGGYSIVDAGRWSECTEVVWVIMFYFVFFCILELFIVSSGANVAK
jgi:hypothetical protein